MAPGSHVMTAGGQKKAQFHLAHESPSPVLASVLKRISAFAGEFTEARHGELSAYAAASGQNHPVPGLFDPPDRLTERRGCF